MIRFLWGFCALLEALVDACMGIGAMYGWRIDSRDGFARR